MRCGAVRCDAIQYDAEQYDAVPARSPRDTQQRRATTEKTPNSSQHPPALPPVLVRGDVTEGLLTRLEGEFLLHRLLEGYVEQGDGEASAASAELWDEVDAFNNRPGEFDFDGYCLGALEAQKAWTEARVQEAMAAGGDGGGN